MSISADVGGKGDLLYGIQDITDLKESVKALRESEERYRTMFDSNSLAVVYTNYEKDMVKINESFTQIFGYTEEDMQKLLKRMTCWCLLSGKLKRPNNSGLCFRFETIRVG